MTPSDKPEFTLAITAMLETLGREASTAMLYGYWVGLEDLPIEAVQKAAAKAIRSCKFAPSPVELRELSGEASSKDRALLAWCAVEKATKRFHSYHTVDFDDGLINAAIRVLGGWPAILAQPTEKFDVFVRKDFIAAYESLHRSGVTGEMLEPLPGLSKPGIVTHVGGDVSFRELRIEHVETGLPALPHIEQKRLRLKPPEPIRMPPKEVMAVKFQKAE